MPTPTRTEHAITHLRSRLREGRYRAAGQLPSEQALAKDLGVSRCIVRNALGTLVREGLVQRLPGMGCIPTEEQPTGRLVRDAMVIFGAPPTEPNSPSGFLNAVVAGAIAAAQSTGAVVVVMDAGICAPERYSQLLLDRPAGLLVGPEIEAQDERMVFIRQLAALGTTVVACSNDAPWQSFDRVTDDQENGAYLLTRHLLASGLKRIALMVPTINTHDWWQARQRGHARALAEAGAICPPQLPSQPLVERVTARDTRNIENRIRATAGWLAAPLSEPEAPDAVIAVTDGDTFPIIEAARLLGRPLAVAGFDNYWTSAWEREFVSGVPLATIDKDNVGIGQEMVRVCTARRNAPTAPIIHHLYPPRLVVTPTTDR